MFKKVMVLVSVLLAVAVVSNAGTLDTILDKGSLRVCMEPGYMPFELTNQKGEIVGYDVDIAKRMAKAMEVKLDLVSINWDGIIPALLTNKCDIIMSGMTVNQGRNLKVNFAEPNIVVGQTILLRKELAGTVKSYKDLNDSKYKVVSKLGTTGEQAVKRMIGKATYISFETEQEGVLEVVNGKADAFIYDLPYCAIANKQKGEGKLVFLDKPFTYEPLAWAVRKGDYDFINWLNNFLMQIKNNGTYDKIYAKWFLDDAWMKQLQN